MDLFNPEVDLSLRSQYSVETLYLKADNKEELQRRFGMEVNKEMALIGVVTRLDSQKGLDLMACVMEEMLIHDHVQFCILGSGEAKF